MAVRLTESRIPGGFSQENAEKLGQAEVKGGFALVSNIWYQSYVGSEIDYYLFTDIYSPFEPYTIHWRVYALEFDISRNNAFSLSEYEPIFNEFKIGDEFSAITLKTFNVKEGYLNVVVEFENILGDQKERLELHQAVLSPPPIFQLLGGSINYPMRNIAILNHGATLSDKRIILELMSKYQLYFFQKGLHIHEDLFSAFFMGAFLATLSTKGELTKIDSVGEILNMGWIIKKSYAQLLGETGVLGLAMSKGLIPWVKLEWDYVLRKKQYQDLLEQLLNRHINTDGEQDPTVLIDLYNQLKFPKSKIATYKTLLENFIQEWPITTRLPFQGDNLQLQILSAELYYGGPLFDDPYDEIRLPDFSRAVISNMKTPAVQIFLGPGKQCGKLEIYQSPTSSSRVFSIDVTGSWNHMRDGSNGKPGSLIYLELTQTSTKIIGWYYEWKNQNNKPVLLNRPVELLIVQENTGELMVRLKFISEPADEGVLVFKKVQGKLELTFNYKGDAFEFIQSNNKARYTSHLIDKVRLTIGNQEDLKRFKKLIFQKEKLPFFSWQLDFLNTLCEVLKGYIRDYPSSNRTNKMVIAGHMNNELNRISLFIDERQKAPFLQYLTEKLSAQTFESGSTLRTYWNWLLIIIKIERDKIHTDQLNFIDSRSVAGLEQQLHEYEINMYLGGLSNKKGKILVGAGVFGCVIKIRKTKPDSWEETITYAGSFLMFGVGLGIDFENPAKDRGLTDTSNNLGSNFSSTFTSSIEYLPADFEGPMQYFSLAHSRTFGGVGFSYDESVLILAGLGELPPVIVTSSPNPADPSEVINKPSKSISISFDADGYWGYLMKWSDSDRIDFQKPIIPTPKIEVFDECQIHFKVDSSELTSFGRNVLRDFCLHYRPFLENEHTLVHFEGFASTTASTSYNCNLSKGRVDTVINTVAEFLGAAFVNRTNNRSYIAFGESVARIHDVPDETEDVRWRMVNIFINGNFVFSLR